MARSLYSTAIATAGFFAAAATLFAFNLESAEGGIMSLAAVWTVSVAPVLPALAALYGMDVWSDERRSGRIDLLLSAPVRERDFTLGKFLGVWTMLLAAVVSFHVVSLAALIFFAPRLVASTPPLAFLPGVVALALQGALWSAVAVAASAMFRHAAAAACSTIAVLVALPRGIWFALLAWAPQGRIAFGEMPLDAQAHDMASGIVSTGTVVSYLVLVGAALFIASKAAAAARLVGRGARGLRFSTSVAVFLSLALAGSAIALAVRLDATFEMPVGGSDEPLFSARTRGILADAHDRNVTVTAFLSRKDSRFRPVGHFLRALERVSASVNGARISLAYVDPRWDFGAAERLVRAGAAEDSLVFECRGRMAALPLRDGYGDRVCASAILRVAKPPARRNVYWTAGHGECSFDAYGNWGMSDIARDLTRDGYRNLALDLSADAQMPSDCAFVVVAGAKSEFSRAETARLETYLRQGGRLLVLLSSAEAGGVATTLAGWGMRPTPAALVGARTLSGTDVIVSEFSDHEIAAPLRGSQVVLEKPVAFAPSAAADGVGADRIEFSPLASVGGVCVAAVAERGGKAGGDLSIRPTRIVAVGDVSFVMNAQLAARANANRDFFLNCVAYLAGSDAMTEAGTEPDRLVSGLDREARVRFVVVTAAAVPALVFAAMLLAAARRRRRG